MLISKNYIENINLKINNQFTEKVKHTSYLENWDISQEMKALIAKTTAAFSKMSKFFTIHDIPITTKIRLLKCYIFSILLYGTKSWMLNEAMCNKTEAF